MNRFQYRLAQFMMGRRGIDRFGRGLFILAMIFILLDFFVPGNVLGTLSLVIMGYAYFRMMSRNIPRRMAEEQWYVECVESRLTVLTQRDHKHYRYFKCPNCRQTLRAPKGKGKIRVTCSSCHNVFEKKV